MLLLVPTPNTWTWSLQHMLQSAWSPASEQYHLQNTQSPSNIDFPLQSAHTHSTHAAPKHSVLHHTKAHSTSHSLYTPSQPRVSELVHWSFHTAAALLQPLAAACCITPQVSVASAIRSQFTLIGQKVQRLDAACITPQVPAASASPWQ